MDTADSSENYTVPVLEKLKSKGPADAIIAGARRMSGDEAVDTVLRFAATLRRSGLGAGDGVALFVANSPEAVLLQLAIHFIGCRMVFVPPEPGDRELEALIQRADVKALLFDPIHEERARLITDHIDVPDVFSIGRSPTGRDFLEAASGSKGLSLREAADGRHVVTLLYTGGTTGLPKLVTHRGTFQTNVLRFAANYTDDVSSRPTLMVATLVTHGSGYSAFVLGVMTGHTIVLLRTFDAGTALSVMERERVTSTMLVTPMLYQLLDHPSRRTRRLPDLRTIFYTGATAAPTRLREGIEHFGPVLHQFYGASEFGYATELTPRDHDPRRPDSLTSCGRPVNGVEVELRDRNGAPARAGEIGEIYVRGQTVMEGYWKDPRRTAEVLDGLGWYRTGDLGRHDDEGCVHLVGRVRDIIVTGSTADNVYSRLLDDFLTELPAIREAATIGLPGPNEEETVHVVLVPVDQNDAPDQGNLTEQIIKALGDLYAPASYSIAGSLPRTTVGKIDKKKLRLELLARRSL